MAVDERARHRLHGKLETVLGQDEAAILMEHLPPVGWADVATKRDLDALSAVTKRDIDALAQSTRQQFDALAQSTQQQLDATRQHIADVATGLRQQIDALGASTAQRIDATTQRIDGLAAATAQQFEGAATKTDIAELRAEFYENQAAQTRTLMIAMVTSLVTTVLIVAGLAFGAARLM